MIKKVLILVVSSQLPPYEKMWQTSKQTWDSVEVEGVESIFYFSKPTKPNTSKEIYFPLKECYQTMGEKMIMAFEWALANKEFDYIARVNSSCYVDKNNLLMYIQGLPDTNVFSGALADSQNGFKYLWGGAQFILSKDVVQRIVENKAHWQHEFIEDESISLLVNWLSIPYTEGYSVAIDNMGDHWRCISYGGESILFTDFSQLVRLKHHFYRVKQDGKRWIDEFIMKELFKAFSQ